MLDPITAQFNEVFRPSRILVRVSPLDFPDEPIYIRNFAMNGKLANLLDSERKQSDHAPLRLYVLLLLFPTAFHGDVGELLQGWAQTRV